MTFQSPMKQAVLLFIGVLALTVVVAELLALPTPEMQATMQAADQWCASMNGTLSINRVVGAHGGIHCRLPSGELVEYQ